MPLFPSDLQRRAVIVIPVEQFVRLLDLPDGLECRGVHADPVRRALVLEVLDREGGTLTPVEPGDVAPEFPPDGFWSREVYFVGQDDGTSKQYVRFGWEEDPDVTAVATNAAVTMTDGELRRLLSDPERQRRLGPALTEKIRALTASRVRTWAVEPKEPT